MFYSARGYLTSSVRPRKDVKQPKMSHFPLGSLGFVSLCISRCWRISCRLLVPSCFVGKVEAYPGGHRSSWCTATRLRTPIASRSFVHLNMLHAILKVILERYPHDLNVRGTYGSAQLPSINMAAWKWASCKKMIALKMLIDRLAMLITDRHRHDENTTHNTFRLVDSC